MPKTPEQKIADRILKKIIYDLSDRRGLRHEWDQIDDDIKREIKSVWRQIIVDELARRPPDPARPAQKQG